MNTPFIDFKAQEITAEKQKKYFVKPRHIGKLISPKASLIFGERGSGKTTILRYLEAYFNTSSSHDYIGLYYRFETAHVKALTNPELTEDKNLMAFSQALAAIIGKLLCKVLLALKKEQDVKYQYEVEICSELIKCIDLDSRNEFADYLYLQQLLEEIRRKTLINLQNGFVKCYLDYTTFIAVFCELLKKEDIFSNTCFCVLFDEYENLTTLEQSVVNSYIKSSMYFLTYKVCMRPDGFLTKNTVGGKEQLIVGHDYEEFDYVDDIIGTESDLKKHLREVCKNRLRYFYEKYNINYNNNNLDIDDYLDFIGVKDEIEHWERITDYKDKLFKEITNILPDYPNKFKDIKAVIDLKLILLLYNKHYDIKEILNNINERTQKYKNWLHNYEYNVIYQIISECEQARSYCGFDVFVKLAHGNARMVLEILHYAFGDYDEESCTVYKKISVNKQTYAVTKVSALAFNEIDYIPVNGYKVKYLVNALGNLFAQCLLDGRAKKFEANSFSIKSTNTFTDEQISELKDVLHDATVWGVLIKSQANKIKNRGDIVFAGIDYILHPIFSPYFKISYRKRQKCELEDVEVFSMLRPKPRSEIDYISKTINSNYVQQKLEW